MRLHQVASGEKLLKSLGFRVVRVRYHGEVARLEVGRDEMARLLEPQIAAQLSREFRKLGFRFVTLDLGGFRSGSLNEGVVASGSN